LSSGDLFGSHMTDIDGDSINWGNIGWSNIDWGNIDWGNIDWGNIDWGNIDSIDWSNIDFFRFSNFRQVILEWSRNLWCNFSLSFGFKLNRGLDLSLLNWNLDWNLFLDLFWHISVSSLVVIHRLKCVLNID